VLPDSSHPAAVRPPPAAVGPGQPFSPRGSGFLPGFDVAFGPLWGAGDGWLLLVCLGTDIGALTGAARPALGTGVRGVPAVGGSAGAAGRGCAGGSEWAGARCAGGAGCAARLASVTRSALR